MFSIPLLLLMGTEHSGFNKLSHKNEKWGQEFNKICITDCASRPLTDIEI
jgi:hypothetical protein